MKHLCTFIQFLSLLFMSAHTHSQVQSKSFKLVLKTLLSRNVPEITVPDAANLVGKSIFLDAREREEYDVSHLPNARFTGYKQFDEKLVDQLPKATSIIVYCAVGKRSENITERLVSKGFTNVHNLYGGIFEWVNQGHPVFNLENKPINKVHAYSRLWGRFVQKGQKVY